ncbi:MAG: hypothetical protein V3V46_06805, partial [Anaerolineales bacterium]
MITILSRNMIVPLGVLVCMLSGCAAQPTPIEQEDPIETTKLADSSAELPAEKLESDPASSPTESVAELRDLEIAEFAV